MPNVRKYRVDVSTTNTWGAQYVPLWEVKCIRAKLQIRRRGADLPHDAIKVSKDISKCPDPEVLGVTLGSARSECMRKYGKDAFLRAYPTDEAFEEEFLAALPADVDKSEAVEAVEVAFRKTMPIEAIKGIGPAIADAIAGVLGDGTFETLAAADPSEIAHLDNVSLLGAKRFISEAKERTKSNTKVFEE